MKKQLRKNSLKRQERKQTEGTSKSIDEGINIYNSDYILNAAMEGVERIQNDYTGFFINTPYGTLAFQIESDWEPMNVVRVVPWASAPTTKFVIHNRDRNLTTMVMIGYDKKFSYKLLLNIMTYGIIEGMLSMLTHNMYNRYDVMTLVTSYSKCHSSYSHLRSNLDLTDELYRAWIRRKPIHALSYRVLTNDAKQHITALNEIARMKAVDIIKEFREATSKLGMISSFDSFHDMLMIISTVRNSGTILLMDYLSKNGTGPALSIGKCIKVINVSSGKVNYED